MGAASRANPVCPQDTSIADCICSVDSSSGTGVALDCTGKLLTDSQFSSILDAFLVCGISPLSKLNAYNNSLTKILSQILKIASLWNLN